jgi:hypothetical protein
MMNFLKHLLLGLIALCMLPVALLGFVYACVVTAFRVGASLAGELLK